MKNLQIKLKSLFTTDLSRNVFNKLIFRLVCLLFILTTDIALASGNVSEDNFKNSPNDTTKSNLKSNAKILLNENRKVKKSPTELELIYNEIQSKLESYELDYESFERINVRFKIEQDGKLNVILIENDEISEKSKKALIKILESIEVKKTSTLVLNQPIIMSHDLTLVFED